MSELLVLTDEGLKQKKQQFIEKGYQVPSYDRDAVRAKTVANPWWIHFGAGNIFRAFQANVVEKLLNEGVLDRGLIVAEGYDYDIVELMNRPHDDLSVLVTLHAEGSVTKTVVGSVVESLVADTGDATPHSAQDFARLREIFASESLQMVSFTITEKGYKLTKGDGSYMEAVLADFENGPKAPVSYIGKVASLLYHRYENGALPVAMVSMDNCSKNGEKLYAAISEFAGEWTKRGVADQGFVDYVNDPGKVSFPWTMIDKITPRPDDKIAAILKEDGLDAASVITPRKTYVAPFVNAEECEYLVIEDIFPNGRPALDKGGLIFTDRTTVTNVERMKVCTCLNPLHTALAVYGCLLGYTSISAEMKDTELNKLVNRIGYVEGLPVVTDPKILSPEQFLREVLTMRIPNPYMPDTPQRIACDTSQKLAIRFGETVKEYMKQEDKNVADLQMIPLVFAGWARYLMALDDNGDTMELSPDPLLEDAKHYLEGVTLGSNAVMPERVRELFKREDIFGINLYDAGIGALTERYFLELIAGKQAVRNTLVKYV